MALQVDELITAFEDKHFLSSQYSQCIDLISALGH